MKYFQEISNEKNRDTTVLRQGVESQSAEHRWLDSREAAAYLRISTKSLLNMVSNGKIPYRKLGRRNRYLLRELQMLMFGDRERGSYGN